MRVLALSSFVLPGAQAAEQGAVYDLADRYATEAIHQGLCEAFTEPQADPDLPNPKPTKKGKANVQR